MPVGAPVARPTPIFTKLDDAVVEEELERLRSGQGGQAGQSGQG